MEADQQKWDKRYREGAYAALSHPSVYLVHILSVITPPVPKALDLACGAGRNSHWLASKGYHLDAVDISSEALKRGAALAQAAGLNTISWHLADLDEGVPAQLQGYGLIIVLRYLDIALLQSAANRLVSGGYLFAEVHMQTDQIVAGPSGCDFRAAPGELKTAADGLQIIYYFEGLDIDPDGRQVALARLLAIKI